MTRVIKNATDYEAVLGEVEHLIERDPALGTPDADRLELLTLLIQNYEARQAPLRLPDPVEAVRRVRASPSSPYAVAAVMHISLRLVRFCGEEIARQRDSPLMVAPLVEAWIWAIEMQARATIMITPDIIAALGDLAMNRITPYRNVPVMIDQQLTGAPPDEIPRLITQLCEAQPLDAFTFYMSFEAIHPWADGNGRVGAILYNWLNGTLHTPIAPPRYTQLKLSAQFLGDRDEERASMHEEIRREERDEM